MSFFGPGGGLSILGLIGSFRGAIGPHAVVTFYHTAAPFPFGFTDFN